MLAANRFMTAEDLPVSLYEWMKIIGLLQPWSARNESFRQMRSAGSELGLSPARGPGSAAAGKNATRSRKSIAPDPVERYGLEVIAGREPAGPLVRLACERHLRDLM